MIGSVSHTINPFEQDYLSLRKKERRLYGDAEVLQLPLVSRTHPHFSEWKKRKESADRLRKYFEKRLSLLKILEVGCGNGWLCHHLAYVPGCDITGVDVNFTELQQGARVFSHIPNLKFIYGSIDAGELDGEEYDFIVFASSIQYFDPLAGTIQLALQKLRHGGEIHILDSPFYKASEIEAAKRRTTEYYSKTGSPEMSRHYFHHSLEMLAPYSYKTLYSPSNIHRYLFNNKNPFHWISIQK